MQKRKESWTEMCQRELKEGDMNERETDGANMKTMCDCAQENQPQRGKIYSETIANSSKSDYCILVSYVTLS